MYSDKRHRPFPNETDHMTQNMSDLTLSEPIKQAVRTPRQSVAPHLLSLQTLKNIPLVMFRAAVIVVLSLALGLCTAGPLTTESLTFCSDNKQTKFNDTNLEGTWRVVYGPAELRDEPRSSLIVNFIPVNPENVDAIKKTIPGMSRFDAIDWNKVKYIFKVPNSSVNFPMVTNEYGRFSASNYVIQLNNLGDYITVKKCDRPVGILLLHKGLPSHDEIRRVVDANHIDGVYMERESS